MPLPIQDLQPLDLVAELAPRAVSGAAGVVGLLVVEGEGLLEPAPIEVEVDQVAGQDAGVTEQLLLDRGIEELPVAGFGMVGIENCSALARVRPGHRLIDMAHHIQRSCGKRMWSDIVSCICKRLLSERKRLCVGARGVQLTGIPKLGNVFRIQLISDQSAPAWLMTARAVADCGETTRRS